MKDPSRANQKLIEEISALKHRIQELEHSESGRKQAEEACQDAEARYRALFEQSPNGILLMDTETGKTVEANETTYKQLGYTREEFAALRISDYEALENPEDTARHIQKVMRDGSDDFETLHRTKSGEIRNVHVWVKSVRLSDRSFFYAIFQDITAEKRAEEGQRRNRETAERLAEEMAVIAEIGRLIGSTLDIAEVYESCALQAQKLVLFDRLSVDLNNPDEATFTVTYVSGSDIPGRRPGDTVPIAGTISEAILHKRTGLLINTAGVEEITGQLPRVTNVATIRAGMHSMISVPLISGDEVIGTLHFRSKKLNAYTEKDLHLGERIGAQIAGAISNAQMFNKLSKAERSLRESEGRFRALVEEAAVGVAEIETSTGRFFTVNRRLCEMVGRTEEELLATTFQAISHPEDLPLHEERTALLLAGKIGHYSLEKRYLRKDGEIVWVNITVSPLWKQGETPGCNMIVVEDIAERKHAEEQLQHTLDSLRKAVNTTIQAMVSAVDVRDPYTAGHQIRSADLARAIVTEMGLPQEKIDAIRMAGTIHDIGKLSIPAEILSKPTKLLEIEFSLIKEHARRGFEMLKDVESPWPLAEIVYQHHERMDGSGYPRKLKGEEILIEARILAVADVVEAMASHRPYRPGLGIDTALNEIERNRGIFYDNAVADACLKLFREKGFQFAET